MTGGAGFAARLNFQPPSGLQPFISFLSIDQGPKAGNANNDQQDEEGSFAPFGGFLKGEMEVGQQQELNFHHRFGCVGRAGEGFIRITVCHSNRKSADAFCAGVTGLKHGVMFRFSQASLDVLGLEVIVVGQMVFDLLSG